MMRLVTSLLAASLLLSACGDDDDDDSDDIADDNPTIDAGYDAAPPPATLTTYVIDLIENQTAANTDPRPFGEFSDLPDPDGVDNVITAYDPLFP